MMRRSYVFGVAPPPISLRSNQSETAGFSLLELLLVLAIVVTVLGLASLSLQGISRDRQGALAELRGVLESARGIAVAQRTDVYVAFATDGPPDPERRYRHYAVFTSAPASAIQDQSSGWENIFQRPLTGVSEWYTLPDGLLFAFGAELGSESPGLATIIEAPAGFRRRFPYPGGAINMPFFLFNRFGMLEIPPLFGERYHNVGIVEAAYEVGGATFPGAPDRIHLGWRTVHGRRSPRAMGLAMDAPSGCSRSLNE